MELEREVAEGMGSRVELFEQIRRDHDREGLSVRALAERHGVHRRAVRQALASPLPPQRKRPQGRPAPKLGPYRALIDQWLVAIGRRHGSSATLPGGSGSVWSRSRGRRSRRSRCVSTCADAAVSWASPEAPSCVARSEAIERELWAHVARIDAELAAKRKTA